MAKLDDAIKNKLLKYQIEHTENLMDILNKNITLLDSSDTGTGKTYCAIALCAQLKLKPIIICPKSVIYSWTRVCDYFKVEPLMTVNYESIKFGKYYVNDKRKQCPFVEVIDAKKETPTQYKWTVDENTIFIFDEVHKCSNINTHNGQLLISAKNTGNKMMILSATIADHPEKFKVFFYILNFIDPTEVKQKKITFDNYMNILYKWVTRDSKPMIKIYSMLYPDRASRMRTDALGDMFPGTQIIAQPYTMEKKREMEIEKEYKNISVEMEKLKDKKNKDKGGILTRILRSHQKIEMLKVPTFVELANDYLENKYSVVIFVNYTQTLELLADILKTKSLVHGGQTKEKRDEIIEKFQSNNTRLIICNIKSGSTGLSLHDVHKTNPRVSLISPTWSSVELVQALGRIHRANGSYSLQRIVYTANTIEDKIAEKIQKKLKNLTEINDGDLNLVNITFETKNKSI